MMGDNRDNSTDSRVLSQVGYVPFENIVGRAADHLLLDPRRRARLGGLALALVGALGPAVLDRAMSRKPKGKTRAREFRASIRRRRPARRSS